MTGMTAPISAIAGHSAAPSSAGVAPRLPRARGPISAAILQALHGAPGRELSAPVADCDPWSDDVQLALTLCYEQHYQGFAGVADGWEWNPGLLAVRADLEALFLAALRTAVPGGDDVQEALAPFLVEDLDAHGISHHFKESGEEWQLREFLAHRSIYHLKEADPHVFVIPRLQGAPKAALVAVEFDEFGGGRADRMHSRLFADLMEEVCLDTGYLHYLDLVPAVTLANVNLMSLLGLHRSLRGALVGHLTHLEITTSPSARRMALALERLGLGERATRFFTEHIEADAVHEQVMRHEVIGGLLAQDPGLAADVVFGVQATDLLDERFADHILKAWRAGESSLLDRLPRRGSR